MSTSKAYDIKATSLIEAVTAKAASWNSIDGIERTNSIVTYVDIEITSKYEEVIFKGDFRNSVYILDINREKVK